MPYIIRRQLTLEGIQRQSGWPYPGEPTRSIIGMRWVELVSQESYDQAVEDHGDPEDLQGLVELHGTDIIVGDVDLDEDRDTKVLSTEDTIGASEGASAAPVGGDDDDDGDVDSTSASSTSAENAADQAGNEEAASEDQEAEEEGESQSEAGDSREVKLKDRGNGWYDVEVDGDLVNEKSLRHSEAKALAEYYEEGHDLDEE